MGQSASRARLGDSSRSMSSSQPTNHVHDPNLRTPAAVDSNTTSGTTTTPLPASISSASKRTNKSSIRKNIRNFLRPSSSTTSSLHSHVDSAVAPDNSRRWRRSRRWSKAPAQETKPHVEPPSIEPVTENDSDTAVDSLSGKGLMTDPDPERDEVRPTEPPQGQELDRAPTPFPSGVSTHGSNSTPSVDAQPNNNVDTLSDAEQETSTNIGTWLAGAGQLAQHLGLPHEDEVVISPDPPFRPASPIDAQIVVEPPSRPPSPENPPLRTPSANMRPFPPPGTLVVVQGVVHTTDISHPQPSTDDRQSRSITPTGLIPGTHRRALSAPRSLVSRSSSPRRENRRSALASSAIPLFDEDEDDDRQTHLAILGHTSGPSGNSASTGIRGQPPSGSTSGGQATLEPESGGLSSSSIDVLGTLLSVAAAATATSLLTGSSEPILSSSFNPVPSASHTDSISTPSSLSPNMRPTSPTPTAGLGGIPPLAFADGAAAESPPPQGHRLRDAWESLRERLGLRPSGTTTPGGADSRLRPDGTPMDAREIMLAEMARAFNLGLGLGNNSNGSNAQSENGNRDVPEAPRPLPAENSFERFLVDLQTDLRVALSENPNATNETEENASAELRAEVASTSGSASMSPANDEENAATSSGRATAPGDNNDSSSADDAVQLAEQGQHISTDASAQAEDQTPAWTGDRQPTVSIPGSTSGSERRPGGGINWWRLYRFPPISTPESQSDTTPSRATSSMSQGPSLSTPSPADEHSHTQTFSSSPTADAHTLGSMPETTLPLPPADSAPPSQRVVVPVIVVGLQSVNDRNEDRPPGSPNAPDGVFPEDESMQGAQAAHRERSWQTRAAQALRNWRPGRRGGSQEQEGIEDGPGSRTFLIYVIGGYYPPDHHIITSANTMNSFEALWEFADLFGQGKPVTATKDEISKSGLEVVKPAQLKQYEEDGKVSSNCLDKCLICLDDYESEDDVRVMACKHAFHKTCVDTWLETGCNNCPACRSAGVPSDRAAQGSSVLA